MDFGRTLMICWQRTSYAGGDTRIRTWNTLIRNQMLYLLSYMCTPVLLEYATLVPLAGVEPALDGV